jgi:hypothetical protein
LPLYNQLRIYVFQYALRGGEAGWHIVEYYNQITQVAIDDCALVLKL